MDLLSSEELQRLSYAELKTYAKRRGIKATRKHAKGLITAILSSNWKAHEEHDSFTCDGNTDTSLNLSQITDGNEDDRNISSIRRTRRMTLVLSEEKISEVTEENQSWSEDSEIEVKTPMNTFKRAGTFCVETPITPVEVQPKVDEVSITELQPHKRRRTSSSKLLISNIADKNQVIPDTKHKATISDERNVMSGHKAAFSPRKVPRKSILRHCKMSDSGEKSSESSKKSKSNGNKVNFITPDRDVLRRSSSTSETPLRSVKDRPKTPIAVRSSLKRKRAYSPPAENTPKMFKTVTTPRPFRGSSQDTKALNTPLKKSDKGLQTDNPVMNSTAKKPTAAATRIWSTRKEIVTPSMSVKKHNASEMGKVHTPNFKEIHQKAFEKMENLEQYHERRQNRLRTLTRSQKKKTEILSNQQQNSSKRTQQPNPGLESAAAKPSRIPQPFFRGIPFIPVVKSIRKIKTNFASETKPQSSSKMTASKENSSKKFQRNLFASDSTSNVFQFGRIPVSESTVSVTTENKQPSRRKFDLKASLAKKLPYKPYSGALRPLTDSNSNQTNVSYMDPIKQKREKSRDVLKGVRKNKRFELQMSRRGII